jgi:glycosyltransferase involved in cell wall biosynthesis
MISIVIPTLWKAEEIYDTILSYQEFNDPNIELIIINNTQRDIHYDGVVMITPSTNIGVNPAWNIGVNAAKYDWVLLLNDDITFNFELLVKFLKELPKDLDFGAIVGDWRYIGAKELNNKEDILTLKQNELGRFYGYGCFMIIPKKYYFNIPLEFKYFWGDDILHLISQDILKVPIYYIDNFKLQGRISVSSQEITEELTDEAFQQIVPKLFKYFQ